MSVIVWANEIKKTESAKKSEESSRRLEIKNAEKLVQKAANVVTANLRAFDKGNASAETVRRSQQELLRNQARRFSPIEKRNRGDCACYCCYCCYFR
jgi:hypothetical protein